MREDSISIAEYFQDIRHPLLNPFISKVPEYFRRYDPVVFWRDLQDCITQDNIPKQVGLDLLIKLMNEEEIGRIANCKYEFLLHGQRMKNEYRRSFIENRYDEGLKVKMLTFLNFMKMWLLPEYVLLHNLLIESTYLSLETLLNYVKQSHHFQITEVVIRLMEENRQEFDREKMLDNYEMQKILEIIMPINLVELEMHHEKEGLGFLSRLTEDSRVAQYNGDTGSGKSTITLFSLGYDLKTERDHQNLIQLVPTTDIKQEHKCIVSKSSNNSETSSIHLVQPNYNFEIDNLLFADKPGQNDTRGLTRQLYNLYLERQLYSRCKRMIFIEIVDIKQLTEKLNKLKEFTSKIARKYEYQTAEDLNQFLVIVLNKCDSFLQQINRLTSTLQQALALEYYAHGKERTVLRYMQQQLQQTRQHVFTVNFYQNPGKRQSFFNYLRQKVFKDPQQVVTTAVKQEIKTAILSTFRNFSYYLSQDFARNQQSIAFYYKQCCRLINFTRLFPRIEEEPDMRDVIRLMNTAMERFLRSKQQIQVNLNNIKTQIQTFLQNSDRQSINQSIPLQTNENLQRLKVYSSIFEVQFSEEQQLGAIKNLIQQETRKLEEALKGQLVYNLNDMLQYKDNLNKYDKIRQIQLMFPQFSTQFLNYFNISHKYFDKIFDSILGKLYNTSRFHRFITTLSNEKSNYLEFLFFTSSVLLSHRVDYLNKYEEELKQSLQRFTNNCKSVLTSRLNFKDQQIPQIRRESQLSIKELNILLAFIKKLKDINFYCSSTWIRQLEQQLPNKLEREINKLKEEMSKHIEQRNRSIFEELTKQETIRQILYLSMSPILTSDQIKRPETENLLFSVEELAEEGNAIFTQSSQNSSQKGILKSTFGFVLRLFTKK